MTQAAPTASGSQRDACLKYACAIQTCLDLKDWQEAKCIPEIAALVRCCDALGAAAPQCIQCAFGQSRYRNLAGLDAKNSSSSSSPRQ
jgi:hypothetical protein